MNTLQSSHSHGGGNKLKTDNIMEELVSITPNERNWRGICIALLVIVAVLALILFFIVLLSPPYEGPFNPGIKFTIDHITGSEFKSSSFNGTWISETEFVFRDHDGGISIFNANNNSVRVLMNNSTFRMYNGVDFMISADTKYIAITKDIKKIHTNTKKAKYRIQDVYSTNQIPLTPFLLKNVRNQELPFIQEVMWSPRGNALIFVYQNNIFYKPEAMSNSLIYQITYTGSETIYNGVPDWLYQEEILKTRKCMWFSVDGRYLAFATFNDSSVGVFKYPVFKTNYQYPEIFSLSYPKVGTANPQVTISVTDLYEKKNGSYFSMKKPDILSSTNVYFINAVWNKLSNKIAIVWMNREQTVSVISICSEQNWNCQEISTVNVTYENGWVEPSVDIIFSNNDKGLITVIPVLDGIGRYPQICYIDIETKVFTPITHGQIVVTRIKAWDQTNHIIYFEAVPEGKPSQRHVYNVSDNLLLNNNWYCLTCPLFPIVNNETNTTSNNISSLFSSNSNNNDSKENDSTHWPIRTNSCLFVKSYFHQFDKPVVYYILECLGPDVPKILIMNAIFNAPSFLLNNQTELAERYARMAKPQIKILQVELETGYQAQVKLFLPPVLRERLEMEFPFLLYIGTSPGGQAVTAEWGIDWNTYLVSNYNFVVGIIDARGSSGQSDEMKYEIQKKIGIVDVEDQLSVLLYLRDNLKFIDRAKIGVWGSGYGGYVTARLLEQDNGTFQCGIAVAPITSWAHYVSIWTERLMATPNVTDNYRGYDEADLTKKVAHFKDKKLLLVHGTADKIVHYQHTMLLVHAFSKHGILFTQLTYPDEDHHFSKSNHHLIRAMETFWNDCFGPTEYEEYDEGLSFLNFAQ